MSLDKMVQYKINVIINEFKKYHDMNEEETKCVTAELFAVASQAIERAFTDEEYIDKVIKEAFEMISPGD